MSDVLKGNFKAKQPVTSEKQAEESLEDRFEREALRRLGGSIAFVSKKKIMWDAKEKETTTPTTLPSKADNGPAKP